MPCCFCKETVCMSNDAVGWRALCRLMHELPGHEASLLPAATRAAVQPLLRPAVAESLQEVASSLKEAAKTRDAQMLLCVRSWASQVGWSA